MPETPVNKQDRVVARKYEVGLSGKFAVMKAVPETARVQDLSKHHFRLRVAGPDRRHHA